MLTVGTVVGALTPYQIVGSEQSISSVEIDSRRVSDAALFVAFEGENVDGHDYVGEAFERGALVALVNRPVPPHTTLDLRNGQAPEVIPAGPICIIVEETMAALQQIAAAYRGTMSARTIGITGSIGKTTTKELVYTVLSQRYRTLRSEGSRNNEIGLPLTLLTLEEETERAVLEMGTYGIGEIALLCNIAKPHIGVVTNIGPVHLERMKTMETIVTAKQELVEALPADGVAVLNHDDHRVMSMASAIKARIFTYGLTPEADLWASDIESMGLSGIRFTFHHAGESVHITVPLIGRHSVHTALRAAAVGLVDGLRWDEIVAGLTQQHAQLRLVTVAGPQESIIIDDTYNSSPESAIAALNLLAELDGRRLAVLGDMLELGDAEEASHRLVGRRALAVADLIIAVGERGRLIGEEALLAGMQADKVLFAAEASEVVELVKSVLQRGDIVLIKGSRGVRLDRIVTALGRES